MLNREAVAGTVLALDCDATVVRTGETELPQTVVEHLKDFRAAGGQVVLLSGRGERHLRATLAAAGVDLGVGECGYVLIDVAFGVVELCVPTGFHSLYSSGEPRNPVAVMHALGIPEYLESVQVGPLRVFQQHRNHDRRATYCVRAIRDLFDLSQFNEDIQTRFGPGFRAFRNGHVGDLRLTDGSTSPVDTLHIAPCDPFDQSTYGKANGLATIANLFQVETSAIHYGGDSVHDLEAGLSAGCHTFGVANCDDPQRWLEGGAKVMRFPYGYGVAEYVIETFSHNSALINQVKEIRGC